MKNCNNRYVGMFSNGEKTKFAVNSHIGFKCVCITIFLCLTLCSCDSASNNNKNTPDTTNQNKSSVHENSLEKDDIIIESDDFVSDYNENIENKVGNLHSNLKQSNDGMMAEQNGWVYFGNPHDDYKLYKMKLDGTDVIKLSDDKACFSINVLGDWIYYTQGWIRGGYICKIRTDGENKTVLYENPCSGLVAQGEWLYFFGPEELDGKTIYKIDISGERLTRINEIGLPNEWELSDLYFRKGYLYFSIFDSFIYNTEGHFSKPRALFSIPCDGSDGQYMFTSFMQSSNFIVTDDGVFYSGSIDGYEGILALTDLPSKTENENTGWINVDEVTGEAPFKEISDNASADKIGYLNGWIFYISNGDIVRIRADYSGEKYVSENVLPDNLIISKMYTLDDWIYVWTIDDVCYKFRIDGSEFQNQLIQ